MNDIQNRSDIDIIIKSFYSILLKDEILAVFFTKITPLNLEHHLPLIGDFWESILLDNPKYKNNAMSKHFEIDQKKRLEPLHFKRWLQLWEQCISSKFKGIKANLAIQRAHQIAEVMQLKLKNI